MTLEGLLKGAKSVMMGTQAPADPVAERAAVLQDLHLAEKGWATEGMRTGLWFARDGDHVAFSPVTRNGAPLTIGGLTTNFVPADRFADYLQAMRTAIERGEFDAEIAAALHGSSNVSGIADVAMPPAREGDRDTIRQAQQDEALGREGRNPDGSIAAVTGHAPR
ncbi:hypothetical protein U1701_12060 [Sphingomonas sp. PB2P19]|uniref:hypothetical protein n=1 Tax=Sphingomonas rhamnosi TaxID=3096156 RepID=UPI002FC74961